MAEMTKSEKKLCELLWTLDYEEREYDVPNNRENAIIIACLVARQYDCANEMLDIVEKNKNKTLDEVMTIITRQSFYPEPPEIVDDDELDDDEK